VSFESKIPYRTLQNALNGVIPQKSTLAKLAKHFGISQDALFANPDKGPNSALLARISLYERISALDNDQVSDVLEYIADRFGVASEASPKPANAG
jgi:transcriptional regulator with XRE-family HTH domain